MCCIKFISKINNIKTVCVNLYKNIKLNIKRKKSIDSVSSNMNDIAINNIDIEIPISIHELSEIIEDNINEIQIISENSDSIKDMEDTDNWESIENNIQDDTNINPINLKEPEKLENFAKPKITLYTLSILETITSGAVSNIFLSNDYVTSFVGGIVTPCSEFTILNTLGIKLKYDYWDSPCITCTMAKRIAIMFNTHIGISTNGIFYNTDKKMYNTYSYICMYDVIYDTYKIYKVSYDKINDPNIIKTDKEKIAEIQVKIAIRCKLIYDEYCGSNSINIIKPYLDL